jgi:hypothetical protein
LILSPSRLRAASEVDQKKKKVRKKMKRLKKGFLYTAPQGHGYTETEWISTKPNANPWSGEEYPTGQIAQPGDCQMVVILAIWTDSGQEMARARLKNGERIEVPFF